MNKTIILLLMGLFCFSGLVFAGTWHIETVDAGGDLGSSNSIALDSAGNPHIAYEGTHCLKYAQWNGATWDIQEVDTSEDWYYHISIALDSADNPHISYYEDIGDLNGALRYAYWTGSVWQIQTISTFGIYIYGTAIALDSSDNPHVSYVEHYDTDNQFLKYVHWTGSAWETQVVDMIHSIGSECSIALDSSDNPHISYRSRYYSEELKYARWTGTTWQIQSVDTEGDVYPCTSIVLDCSDNPHISYCRFPDIYYDGALKYAHWTGSTWEMEVVDTSGGYMGTSNSIALDSSGNPHIAYCDDSNEDLKYTRWTGSTWEIQSVDTEGSVGWSCSIALDSSDNPHISYYDYSNNNLKYAWYEPTTGTNLLSFTATPQEDSSVLLNWRVETTESEQIAGFNLYRHNVVTESYSSPPQKNDEGWTKVNPSLITGQNPYAYTDSAVEPGKTYEYRLEAVLADESTEILGTASCAPTPPAFAITKVYPNPTSDLLNIGLTLPQAGKVTLELYDLTGRLVVSKDIQAVSAGELTDRLDVRELANGVYTLCATQASLSASEKVVVVR